MSSASVWDVLTSPWQSVAAVTVLSLYYLTSLHLFDLCCVEERPIHSKSEVGLWLMKIVIFGYTKGVSVRFDFSVPSQRIGESAGRSVDNAVRGAVWWVYYIGIIVLRSCMIMFHVFSMLRIFSECCCVYLDCRLTGSCIYFSETASGYLPWWQITGVRTTDEAERFVEENEPGGVFWHSR